MIAATVEQDPAARHGPGAEVGPEVRLQLQHMTTSLPSRALAVAWIGVAGRSPLDQAVVVGEDHRVHAVAQLQFGQHPADVGLHGRLGQEELRADLAVREALRDREQDLALARRERRGGIVPAPARRTPSWRAAGRRTAPASSASPARTRRRPRGDGADRAAMSSAGRASFRRNPLAPARRPPNAYSSRSNVVRMMMRACGFGRDDPPGGLDAVEGRASARPSG